MLLPPPPLLVPPKQASTAPKDPPVPSPHSMLTLALSLPPHVKRGVGDKARMCPGE